MPNTISLTTKACVCLPDESGRSASRIISIDTRKPLPPIVDELVPESRDKLEAVNSVGERFVAVYLKDAHSAVKLFKRDGSDDGEIALPGLGTAAGFTGNAKTAKRFTRSPVSPRPRKSSATISTSAQASCCSNRTKNLIQTITRPNRSFTKAPTARGCRCLSHTKKE